MAAAAAVETAMIRTVTEARLFMVLMLNTMLQVTIEMFNCTLTRHNLTH